MTARKQNELGCPRHPLDRFDWDKVQGILTAELSCLSHGRFLFGRLYNDACDEGFEIHSPKTGKVLKFYLHETHKDSDGDVTYWLFKPVTSLGTVSEVIVFND